MEKNLLEILVLYVSMQFYNNFILISKSCLT